MLEVVYYHLLRFEHFSFDILISYGLDSLHYNNAVVSL